jgi:hypothetical protein
MKKGPANRVVLLPLILFYATTTDASYSVDLQFHGIELSGAVRTAIDGISVSPPRHQQFLEYGIFRGHSALRILPESELATIFAPEELRSETLRATLLLLRGHGDAAHETLLGVTLDNLVEAEYAATHPGQTDFSVKHPLSKYDDMLHSLIHRWEGTLKGEGNHTGYENAKYWAAGGPKNVDVVCHLFSNYLMQYACLECPLAVSQGVIAAKDGCEHEIIAEEGNHRTVKVPGNCWDPFAFIEILCRSKAEDKDEAISSENKQLLHDQLQQLEEYELYLLLLSQLFRLPKTAGTT